MAFCTKKLTCLECGFLTITGSELITAHRTHLAIFNPRHDKAPLDINLTRCYRNQWETRELQGFLSKQDLLAELKADRRKCPHFTTYKLGYDPEQTVKRVEKKADRRYQFKRDAVMLLVGCLLTVIVMFLRDFLG